MSAFIALRDRERGKDEGCGSSASAPLFCCFTSLIEDLVALSEEGEGQLREGREVGKGGCRKEVSKTHH